MYFSQTYGYEMGSTGIQYPYMCDGDKVWFTADKGAYKNDRHRGQCIDTADSSLH